MAVLVAFPILGGLLMLQTAIVSRAPLLQGTPDLVMLAILAWTSRPRVRTFWQWTALGGLMVSYVSALPFGVPLISYVLTAALTVVMRRRVWKTSVLVMLAATFVGTLISHVLSFVALAISGTLLPVLDVLNRITLPSLLLNLILAIPIYALLGDLANWFYPEKLEV